MTPFHAPNFVYPTLQIPGLHHVVTGPTTKSPATAAKPLTHSLIVPRAQRKTNGDSTSLPNTKLTLPPTTAAQPHTPLMPIAVLPARQNYAIHLMPPQTSASQSPQQFGGNVIYPFAAKGAIPLSVNLGHSNPVHGNPAQIHSSMQLPTPTIKGNIVPKDPIVCPDNLPKPSSAINVPASSAGTSETGASVNL